MTTVNAESIPDAITGREQWVCWRTECRDRECGKRLDPTTKECPACGKKATKKPTDPRTGGNASSTDGDTWAGFDVASEYDDNNPDTDGVGFVFDTDGLIAGVDLDDCRDPESGEIDPWAREIVEELDSFTEVSPSGTGLHLYVFGIVPDGGNRADIGDGEIEIYDSDRYFTVTGEHLSETPATIEQRADALKAVHAEHVASDDTGGENKPLDEFDTPDADGSTAFANEFGTSLETIRERDDKLDRLLKSIEPSYSLPKDDDSPSGYDMAAASKLWFWRFDEKQISQILRTYRSRPKMQRDDYVTETIRNAKGGERCDPPHADGGTATAAGNDNRDGLGVEVSPAEVIVRAGLGEDGQVSDLNDREKAAIVWDLIKASDEFHVRVMRETNSLWSYDGGVWNPQGVRTLRHAARQSLGSMNYGQNVLSELEAQARSDPTVEIEADDLGLEPGLLAVDNGMVDLEAAARGRDGALRELAPEDLAMAQLPVEYDPEGTYDRWADLVDEWTEEGRADALQEYVGYCLHTGGFPIHRALLLVGSGANGKSVFLSVVREMLGRENTTSIELQTLANEDNAVADFYGAVANIDDDLSARKLGQGLGMFKKLTGDNRVRARRLYEEGFEFDATGKHLYAANEVPDVNVDDDDEAFWRRWLLVEFPNYYPPHNRNPDLCADLTEPGVLSGVLNWAIEGWHRLLDQGKFTGEAHYAHEKRQRWQRWGDSVDKFIEECVEHDPDAKNITTSTAYSRYVAWCQENQEECVGQQKFTNQMKVENVGYSTSVRPGGTGNPTNGYKALAFTDDVPHAEERRSGSQARL